jgi:hypothetical protein
VAVVRLPVAEDDVAGLALIFCVVFKFAHLVLMVLVSFHACLGEKDGIANFALQVIGPVAAVFFV